MGMANASQNLIISGVLLAIIGFIGTFSDTLMAGAVPPSVLPMLSSIKVFVFEPLLVIGVILLVIGIITYPRGPRVT